MGGNLFTHAMSEAEVQAHEVRLKLRVSEWVEASLHTKRAIAGSSARSAVKAESGKLKAERGKVKAASKRAQRKFTCKLHSERKQIRAHNVRLKLSHFTFQFSP